MKSKMLCAVCGLALALALETPANAAGKDPGAIAADVIIGRPFCLLATIVGSAIFVVALPVAATSGSIDSAADALVVRPARATFTRPLGVFSSSDNYASSPTETKRVARSVKRSRDPKKS